MSFLFVLRSKHSEKLSLIMNADRWTKQAYEAWKYFIFNLLPRK